MKKVRESYERTLPKELPTVEGFPLLLITGLPKDWAAIKMSWGLAKN